MASLVEPEPAFLMASISSKGASAYVQVRDFCLFIGNVSGISVDGSRVIEFLSTV